ncbi:MAG: ABC transporter ATP-binding protein [Clostridiales bacterium]|nr:ABC transporter ATP-binding protein [Clostridiales bacterium]
MDTTILSIKDIKKNIKKKSIIKGISFEIKAGEVLGFLGPNGAGKSTSLRMIVGLTRPSSGEISICGHSIRHNNIQAMKNVGCIIENPDLYDYLSGLKNLQMLAAMTPNITQNDIMQAISLVGMENRIKDKVSTYSMGMKQRLGIAQALMHHPKLLVLDEPMNGLDPEGIYKLRTLIQRLAKEENVAALISSHLISEVQLLCDRVVIINNGLLIQNLYIQDLIFSNEITWVLDDLEKAQVFLKANFAISTQIIDGNLRAAINSKDLPLINRALILEGFQLKYVQTQQKSLESLFLDLTENQKIT